MGLAFQYCNKTICEDPLGQCAVVVEVQKCLCRFCNSHFRIVHQWIDVPILSFCVSTDSNSDLNSSMLHAQQHNPKSQNLTICLWTIPQVCLTIHHLSLSLSPVNAPQIVIMCYTAKKNHKSCKMPTNQKHWFYEDVMYDNARQNNNTWCQPNAQVPHYDALPSVLKTSTTIVCPMNGGALALSYSGWQMGRAKQRIDWLSTNMATKQDNRTPEPSEGPLTPEEWARAHYYKCPPPK